MDFKQFYKTIQFDIDKEIRTVLQATQGDTKSRGLLVPVVVNSVVTPITTETMNFFALKPDGTRVMTAAVKDGDKFRIDFTNQTFAVPGVLLCALVLYGTDGEKISDKKFKMTVDTSLGDGAIISEDERGILDRAFDLASDIVPRLEALDVPLLENLEQRIDDIIATPVPTGAIIAEEIIDARQGKESLGANITEVKSQLTEIEQQLEDGTAGIDDSVISSNKVWSSSKVNSQLVDITDEVNDLILKGVTVAPPEFANSVEELTDTSKVYVLPDGYLYAYMTTALSGMEEVTERVTGDFLDNKRLSTSSGELKEETGFVTTPFIDVSQLPTDFKIKLTGIRWAYNDDGDTIVNGYAMCTYTTDGTVLTPSYTINKEFVTENIKIKVISKTEVEVTLLYPDKSIHYTYLRFCGQGTSSNAVVELIYDKEVEGRTETKWTNTGHAYQPTDYESRIIDLENQTELMGSQIYDLQNTSIGDSSIPTYVKNEAEEVADKVLEVRSADSFVMGLASDFHTNGEDTSATSVLHAGQGMSAINSMTQLDLVALLGDYEIYGFSYGDDDTDGEDARKSFKHVKKSFSTIAHNVPFMQLQGNHDELPADSTEEARQKYYAYMGANNIGTVTDYDNKFRNYGYRDFDNHKIRVIYLNTTDVSDSEITSNCNLSPSQMEWLINTAFNIEKDDASEWGVIALSHHPLNWFTGTIPMWTILDGFKGKKSGSVVTEGVTIPYDFTTITSEFICHFHGHIHNFRAEKLSNATLTEGITTITIPNACYGRNNEYGTASAYGEDIKEKYGDVDENGVQRQFNKTVNTADDTAFNVVVVDRAKRKVHCVNYGAGIDREVDY